MTKTLLITGASSGIGFATAAHFLKQNYRVINLSRKICDLAGVHNLALDLQDQNSLSEFKNKLPQIFETPCELTVIHNAFSYFHDSVNDFSMTKMQEAFQVGIVAPSVLNQALLPFMQERSSILYVGSTLSEKAVPGCLTYVTLKHAVVGLMRSCAQDNDLRLRRVHTACICPGFTETDMLKKHASKTILAELTKEKVFFQRLIDPKEVAELLSFCSKNPVIHGSVIHSNLGQMES